MQKTLPKTLPRKGRDKSVGAKGDTKGGEAVSANNKLVGYGQTCRRPEGKKATHFAGFT